MAALEEHAQHLMLRVLLSGPPEGLSTVDATQGLAFLAMLFNVTSVVRLDRHYNIKIWCQGWSRRL